MTARDITRDRARTNALDILWAVAIASMLAAALYAGILAQQHAELRGREACEERAASGRARQAEGRSSNGRRSS